MRPYISFLYTEFLQQFTIRFNFYSNSNRQCTNHFQSSNST